MKFKKAIQQTAEIADAYRPGLQALREVDRARIRCAMPRHLTGSIDLDSALAETLPNEPRWDYGIGFTAKHNGEQAVWVEVHPASSQSIGDMLRKIEWLKNWLSNETDSLNKMSKRFVWISSGKVALTPASPQRKKIALAGIEFVGETLQLS